MKIIAILLSGSIKNDSRVSKIINTLVNKYTVIVFSKDKSVKLKYYRILMLHNRYNEIDKKYFNPDIFFIKKIIRKALYYMITEYIKFRNCSKLSPDIYYCNDFNALIAGYLASKKNKAKVVYDSHELWSERACRNKTILNRFKRILESYIEKYIIKRCNAVITVSEGIAEELSRRYKIKKPYVIRNLDEIKEIPSYRNRILLRDKLNIPRNAILLVYQGSLADVRGIPELIEAMDKLPNNIHLLLMGKYLPDCSRIMLKRNNRIHYIGMISEKDLFNYTTIGDIGIAPIRTVNILSYKLAFPNKFSQYMNAGLTLALYKTGESEKLVRRCKCGVVFKSGNSRSILSAIENIIDSGNIKRYKKQSRKAFLKYYNWELEKHKLKKIINDL